MFLTNLYPPNAIGGYERLCFDVAEAMAERGHKIFVLTSNYGGKSSEYPDQIIERDLFLFANAADIYAPLVMPNAERYQLMQHNIQRLNHFYKKFRPDVLFIWNLYFFDESILNVINGFSCKVVYLLTDNWLITFTNPTFMPAYFAQRIQRSRDFVKQILSKTRQIWAWRFLKKSIVKGNAIFPSKYMRNLHLEAGISFDDYAIVHHGVKLDVKKASQRNFKRCDGSKGHVKFLFAGRVVEIKGVHTIIEAMPEIVSKLLPVTVDLTILGDRQDERYLARLKDRINKLGLESIIRFVPPVTEERLSKIFAEYDIYLFPSLYEPFSLTLIHALASGIPIVASGAGGNREIVFHQDTGLIHAAGDYMGLAKCVLQILWNPEMCRDISMRGQRIGQEHTFDRMVNKIENYLNL